MLNKATITIMSKNIKLLYLINFFSSFRFISPILIIHFAQVTGSYTQAMTLIAFDSLFQAILEIPTGIFSDLIGRKSTTILAGIAGLFCVGFWAIGGNFWLLFIGTFFGGLSGALSSGNDEALIYDSLKEDGKEDQFHTYFSRIGTLVLLAFGISAFLGGLVATISFQLVFALSMLFNFISVLISFFLTNPHVHKKLRINPYTHLKEASLLFITNPSLRMLSISSAITSAFSQASYQFTPIFVNTVWPIWAVGILRSSTHFISAAGNLVSGKVIDRFKAFNVLINQFIISRIILMTAFVLSNIYSPLLIIINSFGFSIGQVAQRDLIQKEFTDHQRATMGSLDSLLKRILTTLVLVLMGYFADLIGPDKILLLGEVLLIPLILVYWKLHLHQKRNN